MKDEWMELWTCQGGCGTKRVGTSRHAPFGWDIIRDRRHCEECAEAARSGQGANPRQAGR